MNFYETLTAAVNDFEANGFDSVERLDLWTKRLREAAERTLTSPAQIDAMLRNGLAAIYRRLVEKGGIKKYNIVPQFTLDRIKPHLRAELDRRIMASANLIKLNREESIQATLRRFQGWATSIPVGGTETAEKVEAKTQIRKSLARLPFESRRVLIDQGHKLTASISQIVATGSNAIAAQWFSNWRQMNYNYRPDHKDRDLKIYLLKDSWARERGLVKASKDGYYDDITKVAEEPFCRCYAKWIYNLRDLPPDMLTEAGAAEMDRVKRQIAAGPLAAPGAYAPQG